MLKAIGELKVLRESLELLQLKVQKVIRGRKDHKAHMELKDLKVFQEQRQKKVIKVQLVRKDHKDHEVQ